MKKTNYFFFGLIIIILLSNCDLNPSETKYSVWTEKVTYSQFSNIFGTLNDDTLTKITLTESQFISLNLSNNLRKNWTEDEIFNWFYYDMFLTLSQSNELKNWLINTKYCIVAIRTGGFVDMIYKRIN